MVTDTRPSQTQPAPGTERDPGRDEIAFVLLLVQSGLGVLSLAGVIVVAAAGVRTGLAAVPALVQALAPLVLAFGVAARRPWARRGTLAYEALALAGFTVNALVALSPRVGLDLGAAALLTGVALPAAIVGLLVTPSPPRPAAAREVAAAGTGEAP